MCELLVTICGFNARFTQNEICLFRKIEMSFVNTVQLIHSILSSIHSLSAEKRHEKTNILHVLRGFFYHSSCEYNKAIRYLYIFKSFLNGWRLEWEFACDVCLLLEPSVSIPRYFALTERGKEKNYENRR